MSKDWGSLRHESLNRGSNNVSRGPSEDSCSSMGKNRVPKVRESLRHESLNRWSYDVSRGAIDEILGSIIECRISEARVDGSGVVDLLSSWRGAKEVQ